MGKYIKCHLIFQFLREILSNMWILFHTKLTFNFHLESKYDTHTHNSLPGNTNLVIEHLIIIIRLKVIV